MQDSLDVSFLYACSDLLGLPLAQEGFTQQVGSRNDTTRGLSSHSPIPYISRAAQALSGTGWDVEAFKRQRKLPVFTIELLHFCTAGRQKLERHVLTHTQPRGCTSEARRICGRNTDSHGHTKTHISQAVGVVQSPHFKCFTASYASWGGTSFLPKTNPFTFYQHSHSLWYMHICFPIYVTKKT